MEKFFKILLISLILGIFVMFVMGLQAKYADIKILAGEYFALVMFLFQIGDFLIVVRVLVECLELEKVETKYYIVKASDIKRSSWRLSGKINYTQVFYEYEGKSRRRIIWANAMISSKDHRLLLLVPENKHQKIYAFPLVNFVDVMN